MDEDPAVDDSLGTKEFKLSNLPIGIKVNQTFKFDNQVRTLNSLRAWLWRDIVENLLYAR